MKKRNIKKQNNKKKNIFQSQNDPLGAYTGTPESPYEMPVQDVDDL